MMLRKESYLFIWEATKDGQSDGDCKIEVCFRDMNTSVNHDHYNQPHVTQTPRNTTKTLFTAKDLQPANTTKYVPIDSAITYSQYNEKKKKINQTSLY